MSRVVTLSVLHSCGSLLAVGMTGVDRLAVIPSQASNRLHRLELTSRFGGTRVSRPHAPVHGRAPDTRARR
jgi:hypothetical protein